MKKILVTGGCGFIASNFIQKLLLTDEYFVVNIDKMDYCSSHKNISVLYDDANINQLSLKNYKFYNINLLETDKIKNILIDNNISIIYHFAAQSHVDNSFNGAQQFVVDNVLGTTSLLEACRQYILLGNKIEKFIHVSTDEVYGDVQIGNEEKVIKYGKLDPTNPYAASKAAAELMVQSYVYSYKLPVIITRSNNVYGPGQYWEKIIPKFIYTLSKDQKIPVYGDGSALRKYLFIEDACDAYLLILEKGEIGTIYEMGSDIEFSALEMAALLIQKIKPDECCENWINFVEDRHFHDSRYLVNPHQLDQLGWKAKTSFSKGLDKTINWYLNYAIPNRHWN
jgi:UDP-glucose 4,6-dehydratase